MNKRKIIYTGLLLMLSVFKIQAQNTSTIIVQNTTAYGRTDELIVLKRALLQQKCKQLNAKNYVIVKDHDQPLVVQYDDLNGDGVWDEAVFLYSFKPKEKTSFSIEVSDKPATIKAVVKAHARHKYKLTDNSFGESVITDTMPFNNQPTDFTKKRLPPYLTEGPAWENDKVGFRKYFDVRNANDLWGKTTDKMVMDKVGVNPDSVYHHLSWWGMDILKVGKSLGAGAIALKIPLNAKGKDTLLRMGSNTKSVVYRLLADGPVRAMFSIIYTDCNVAEKIKPVTVIETISIWGGQYFYNNEVQMFNAPEGTELATGIPDFYNCTMDSIKTKSAVTMYSWGKQSENNDTLAMAVMVPSKMFDKINTAKNEHSDISNTYLLHQRSEMNKSTSYRFYSLWQLTDKEFTDPQKVKSFLTQQSALIESPLMIE